MCESGELFSIRIVIVDFYLEKPRLGLDPCFCEFRGKEIKKVPIIRVFGSNADGQKSCMHVHGVFPYFYIAYEKKEFESLEKAVYMIASSLDKAINVSLGQASSTSQHVFKVQLVKGIPFYGYHKKEHQFLKIYMLNPRFVRRAANLLQNGAIMGKLFHPYESHVPYILQFMIDFNLYGMSFLHVPREIVKFRRKNENEEIPYSLFQHCEILDSNLIPKMTTTKLEVDINSSFILNRFQLANNANTHSNPGVQAIWNDEKVRRQNLMNVDREIPTLEIPATQQRPYTKPTDSEIFYRTALVKKLEAMAKLTNESSINKTLNSTQTTMDFSTTFSLSISSEQKRTFNLKKFLVNAIYPEECTQKDQLINASFVENHLSSQSSFQTSMTLTKTHQINPWEQQKDDDNSGYLEETMIDEELVLNLTQPSLQLNDSLLLEDDIQFLDVLQKLEENNCDQVDLDSTLAPLSQNINCKSKLLNIATDTNTNGGISQKLDYANDYESDQDSDETHDFTICVEDIDDLLSKLSQYPKPISNENIEETTRVKPVSQLDGSDDSIRTPSKKCNEHRKSQYSPKTPKKTKSSFSSPTRNKSTSKYAPLPIIIGSRSTKKEEKNQNMSCQDKVEAVSKNICFLPEASSSLPSESAHSSDSEKISISSEEGRRSPCGRKVSYLFNKFSQLYQFLFQINRPYFSLRKKLALMRMKKGNLPIPEDFSKKLKLNNSNKEFVEKSSLKDNKSQDLDKTHIICSLTPVKRKNAEKRLKMYNLRSAKKDVSNKSAKANKMESEVNNQGAVEKLDDCQSKQREQEKSSTSPECSIPLQKKSQNSKFDKKLKVNIKRIQIDIAGQSSSSGGKQKQKIESTIFPEDTISTICRSQNESNETHSKDFEMKTNDSIQTYALKTIIDIFSNTNNSPTDPLTPSTPKKISDNQNSSDESDVDDDNSVYSFYEKSFIITSPSAFGDVSPSQFYEQDSCSASIEKIIKITPIILPPNYNEVKTDCRNYEIYEHEFQHPFYSDSGDVTHKKEIGQKVLSIPGNTLNDCEEFHSLLGSSLKGLEEERKDLIVGLCGPEILNRLRSSMAIKEFFATNKRVVIVPYELPPTKRDAKDWIKARQILLKKNLIEESNKNFKPLTDDSPLKVRSDKITMMLNVDNNDLGIDCDEDSENYLFRSVSLTPLNNTNANKISHLNKITSDNGSLKCIKSFPSNLECKLTENSIKVIPMEQDQESFSHEKSQLSQSISSQVIESKLKRKSFVKFLQSSSSEGRNDGSFGISSNSSFGFKVDLENLQQVKADVEHNNLTILIVEVFVETRNKLVPDPNYDAIKCIFYAIQNNTSDDKVRKFPNNFCGYIIAEDTSIHSYGIDSDVQVNVVSTELGCLLALIDFCELWDPDILAGYEIEMSSWGYIIERGKKLDLNIVQLLSRVPTQKARDFTDEDQDQLTELDVEMKLCGRILLDVWRLMRSEIALTSYTFENVLYHILHRRCPRHQYSDLTNWFIIPQKRWIVLEYYLERVKGTMLLLEQLDLIGRTSEMAKLIGIQFYEVLSRGSQFRVESMMLRIAKPRNFVPLSPSVQQRAHMRAPEYLPLIMEPESCFYPDPVIVLDFQSLYPSMIIAYNYCFSTCLGRVEHLGQSTPFEFGASQLRVPAGIVSKLLDRDLVSISPCGVVFVKSEIREGILPKMLTEILNTRQMVKQSMKLHKKNSALQRVLHSRQLGLKLMANVTYGYTAANFSGRMPSVEVGDSVVAKGRETLERAIKLVESNDKWNAKVVYGDTDSLFVLVRGRSRNDAFAIGTEIADAVTKDNPQPVKLKLEKVYQPCILQTKKRYVGYMYETADQEMPVYEAKGIETVRRDGCPIVQKMLEKCLRILFETTDVSIVKKYVCHQFTKLLSGEAHIQDLIFAKEFRGLSGYKPTACVPALELTRKWIQSDPRKIPRRGERVPFVIINGPPGLPLIRLVRSPDDVLNDENLKINAIYYITKAIIPPLNRCFLLIGADINEWFTNLPRKIFNNSVVLPTKEIVANKTVLKKNTISQYFSTTKCIIDCGRQTKNGICSECCADRSKSVVTLNSKIGNLDRSYNLTNQICQSCCGRASDIACASLDCPVLYVLETKRRNLNKISCFQSLLEEIF